MPLGYLGDAGKTVATFPVVDGVRLSVLGGRARLLAGDLVELLGREATTINTGGEKVFAEEVEAAVRAHPGVLDAVVCGRPSERWGAEVVALVALRPGVTLDAAALAEHCAGRLARYKMPRAVVVVDEVRRSPSGKCGRWPGRLEEMAAMGDSVTVHMAAPAERIWTLVSEVTNTGRFSPETFEAQWLDGATGPAIGARFRGHVKRNGRGPVYWTVCRVTACDPGREFGFEVLFNGSAINNWHYRFTPSGDGTDVTESYALADRPVTRIYGALLGRMRNRTNVLGMRETLERIKVAVEPI